VIYPYAIQFENKPEATAPAQTVTVTQQLDDDLDWSTFQLGSIGFGDTFVTVPPGRKAFSTRVNAIASRGVFVDVSAEFNPSTGVVEWTFSSLDPLTLDVPADPFAGFLPPNLVAPEGDGFVAYNIRPKASLPSGTRIDAQATVVFDVNAPIDTPAILNTIDAGPPNSQVDPLPATTASASFSVSWTSDDDSGSGVAEVDVYVSDNGGPVTLFYTATTETSTTFVGEVNHTYAFYSIARDNLGFEELPPSQPDTITEISEFQIRNPNKPLDVSGNDKIEPFDALLVLSYLVRHGSGVPTASGPPYYDTTTPDNLITPQDAVVVLAYLKLHGSGEGEPLTTPVPLYSSTPMQMEQGTSRWPISPAPGQQAFKRLEVSKFVEGPVWNYSSAQEDDDWLDQLAESLSRKHDAASAWEISLQDWIDRQDFFYPTA